MRTLTILVAVLALSLGIFASPVLSGGWAVTTFDDLPAQFVSGKEYLLGYTIRQHGQTPINVDKTEILAVARSGRALSFPGRSEGVVGHYIASVFFPAGGTYTWQVTQGGFAPQDLGTLTVLAAAGTSTSDKTAATDTTAATEKAALADKGIAPAAPASAPATSSGDPMRSALSFAAAAAAAMFLWRLVTMLRAARRTRATV